MFLDHDSPHENIDQHNDTNDDDLFNLNTPLRPVPYMNPPEVIFGALYG